MLNANESMFNNSDGTQKISPDSIKINKNRFNHCDNTQKIHSDSIEINESILNDRIRQDMQKTRTNHMEYIEGMEVLSDSNIMDRVITAMNQYDYHKYTAADIKYALDSPDTGIEEFAALLSPAADAFLEEMAEKAKKETRKHFGNSVLLFTPLYISNYCENYCIYCGFNCQNQIKRARLDLEGIEREMEAIAQSGLEEILILTGESRSMSDVPYIGEACKISRKYFKMTGL